MNNNTRIDLVLSTIIVQPNASKLNAEDITDKRPDKTYCGFVTGVIDQIDTTELFQQYDETFQTWFNEMKDQLSTDAAGNLQTQIGLLSSLKTKVKDSVVNAINSLYDSTIGKTLKTLEEVKSNTEQGFFVDALAVAELNSKCSTSIETNGTEPTVHSSADTWQCSIKYTDGRMIEYGICMCHTFGNTYAMSGNVKFISKFAALPMVITTLNNENNSIKMINCHSSVNPTMESCNIWVHSPQGGIESGDWFRAYYVALGRWK